MEYINNAKRIFTIRMRIAKIQINCYDNQNNINYKERERNKEYVRVYIYNIERKIRTR